MNEFSVTFFPNLKEIISFSAYVNHTTYKFTQEYVAPKLTWYDAFF